MALEPVEPGQLWAGAGGFCGLQLAIRPVDGTRCRVRPVQEVPMREIKYTVVVSSPGSLLLSDMSWRIPVTTTLHLRLAHGADTVLLRTLVGGPLPGSMYEVVWRP